MIEMVGLLIVRIHFDIFGHSISETSHIEADTCERLNLTIVS